MEFYKNTLPGRVAVVTGAGSGIGRATAKLFAYAGARVGVLGHTESEVEHTVAEIRGAGGEALALVADISQPEQMQRAYQTIESTWQKLDIVIANAGINGLWAPLEEITEEAWDQTTNVNLKGTFLTVKYALPLLKVAGGAVVIVSSVNGTRIFSNTGATVYATTKAGQVAFARMIALELAKHRVRVNTVCPGSIETRIDENTTRQHLEQIREPVDFPAGRVPLTQGKSGSSQDVAELLWFLVSDGARHITGAEVFIDGGESLLQG